MNSRPGKPIELILIGSVVIAIGGIRSMGLLAALFIPEVRDLLGSLDVHSFENAVFDLPLELQYFVSATGATVFLVTGVGLLATKNWARIILVAWIGLSLVFSYLVTGSAGYLLPQLAIYLMTVALLFTPRANRAVHAA